MEQRDGEEEEKSMSFEMGLGSCSLVGAVGGVGLRGKGEGSGNQGIVSRLWSVAKRGEGG